MSDQRVSIQDFRKLDLRVAQVHAVRDHPNADKLLLLTVDAGDGEKQLVAGVRGHYEPESLVGRRIIVIHNLEPATIRGETSDGMLLAATNPVTGAIRLLSVDGDLPVGSRIS